MASQAVARGQLARIQLAPGTYAISGIFGEPFSNGQHLTTPSTFVVIPARWAFVALVRHALGEPRGWTMTAMPELALAR